MPSWIALTLPVASIDELPAVGPVDLVGRGGRRARAQARGQCQAVRRSRRRRRRWPPRALRQAQHHQPHRPGAVDQDVRAELRLRARRSRAPRTTAVRSARRRRSRRRRAARRSSPPGPRQYSAAPPGDGDADRGPPLAQVVAADAGSSGIRCSTARDRPRRDRLRGRRARRRRAATTVPANSWPGTMGSDGANSPCRMCRSVPHSPHAATSTTTSPAWGVGSSTVSIPTSPTDLITAAFT